MQGLLVAALLFASPVKTDEQVVLFPVSARWDEAGKAWVGELHGWIFEPEEDSDWRDEVVESLEDAAELDRVEWDSDLFRARVRPFLVDNERGKHISVRAGGVLVVCELSSPNGHFFGKFSLPRDSLGEAIEVLHATAVLDEDDERRFVGSVYLIPPEGISVVSDIDDTIKLSTVTDKVELLRNTFARPFAPVPGMANAYRTLAERGAAFHYVSASPWQLYEPFDAFRAQESFPAGTFDMKLSRVWDDSWCNLTADSGAIKKPAIERLLSEYPARKFILIGDSGEADPEIYGDIAREAPEQVTLIAIRRVREQESLSDERFQSAFREIPTERVLLFEDPTELRERLEAP